MTTRTNALLQAAIVALVAQVSQAKKAGLETLGLGTEIIPGVKFRDLKNWLKENGNVQHDAKPAAKAPVAKTSAATAKAVGKAIDKVVAKQDAPEFTTKELKGSDLLIGRAKTQIKSVVKSPEGVRVAITETGVRVPVSMIERNNRGNLRTVEAFDPKAPATKTAAAAVKAEVKAPAAKAETKPAATGRELVSRPSSNLISAIYNRDDKTLTVTFKSGAVWQYEGVGIREANAMAKEESHGKYFTANIKNAKDGKCLVRGDKAPAKTVAEAPVKTPAAKATAAKVVAGAKPVAEENELKATEVRGQTVLNGRTKEVVERVVRNKETQRREVVCESGARFPLAMIERNNRGNLRVIEVAATVEPATAKGGAVKKAAVAKAESAPETKSTNRRADFTVPKISEVRGATFTVTKGSKSKEVTVKKVFTKNDVRVAQTENGGTLVFDDLSLMDGVLHYNGKLMASDFHAL